MRSAYQNMFHLLSIQNSDTNTLDRSIRHLSDALGELENFYIVWILVCFGCTWSNIGMCSGALSGYIFPDENTATVSISSNMSYLGCALKMIPTDLPLRTQINHFSKPLLLPWVKLSLSFFIKNYIHVLRSEQDFFSMNHFRIVLNIYTTIYVYHSSYVYIGQHLFKSFI